MRVRYDEGVAIHVGPEPCVSAARPGAKRRQGTVQASHRAAVRREIGRR